MFSQWFDRITDAIENERKLKKWSRAKKEAFVRGDSRRHCSNFPRAGRRISFEAASDGLISLLN